MLLFMFLSLVSSYTSRFVKYIINNAQIELDKTSESVKI